MSAKKEGPFRTLLVATCLCVVCSVLVSTAAVELKSLQERNKKLDIQKNILLAANLLPDAKNASEQDITQAFARIEKKGEIYLVKDEQGETQTIILPVEGRGLWSTLYGFLAMRPDGRTVVGLRFYQHGETPGLGGEVDNPRWLASWQGKQIVDEQGNPILKVLKGAVDASSPQAHRQIDGLSGATITGRGVEGLVNHWLGPQGHGPVLEELKAQLIQPPDEELSHER